jgi:uncharacterized membrane protein YkvA (DUF1232 family)
MASRSTSLFPWLIGWVRGLWRLYRNPSVPAWAKWLCVGLAAAYLLWPIDLIPDWPLPFIGYVDDAVMVPLLLSILQWLVPRRRSDAAPHETAGTTDAEEPPSERKHVRSRTVER